MKKLLTLMMAILIAITPVVGMAEGEKTDLVFFTWFGEGEREMAEAIVALFEETHPNINVDANYITYNDYHSKLNTLIAAGKTPDVFIINDFFVNEWGTQGIVMNLKDVFAQAGRDVEAEYLPGSIFRTGPENVYGLSWCQSSFFLFYNKDLFAQAGITPPTLQDDPWTYDELTEAAIALTKDINGKTPKDEGFDPNSVVTYGFVNSAATHWSYLEFMIRSAGVRFTEDGRTWSLFSDKGISAIQQLADLALVHQCAPTLPIQRGTFNDVLVNMLNGQVAMCLGANSNWAYYNDLGYDCGIAKLPIFSEEAYVGGGAPFAIGSDTQNVEAALEFLSFFTTFENQLAAAESSGLTFSNMPSNTSPFSNPETMERWYKMFNKEIADVALDILGKIQDTGINAIVRNFSQAMETIVAPALDEVWLGEITAAELAERLAPQLEGSLGGYWGE